MEVHSTHQSLVPCRHPWNLAALQNGPCADRGIAHTPLPRSRSHRVWNMWSTTRTPALPLLPNVIKCARGTLPANPKDSGFRRLRKTSHLQQQGAEAWGSSSCGRPSSTKASPYNHLQYQVRQPSAQVRAACTGDVSSEPSQSALPESLRALSSLGGGKLRFRTVCFEVHGGRSPGTGETPGRG